MHLYKYQRPNIFKARNVVTVCGISWLIAMGLHMLPPAIGWYNLWKGVCVRHLLITDSQTLYLEIITYTAIPSTIVCILYLWIMVVAIKFTRKHELQRGNSTTQNEDNENMKKEIDIAKRCFILIFTLRCNSEDKSCV